MITLLTETTHMSLTIGQLVPPFKAPATSNIEFNLDQLNIYHGIKTHKQKKGMFVGLFDLLKRKRREKKVAKEFSNDVEEEPKKKSKKKKK